MSRLSPETVLRRDPAAQAVDLPDGRLLIRHRRGISLLRGVTLEDVRKVLDLVDGRRTAAEVCAALADEYDEAAVRRLLESLTGEWVHAVPQEPMERKARPEIPVPGLVLLGNGSVGDVLAERLEQEGWTGFRRVDFREVEGLSAALVLCALEDVPYDRLLDVQKDCLETGTPVLFLTFDPDGARIGPTAVPGTGPCFGCAQLASFGFLGLDPGALLEAVRSFRAGSAEGSVLDRALSVLISEAQAVLAGGEPASLTGLSQLGPDGNLRRSPLERHPRCPLCTAAPRNEESPIAARAGRIVAETLERQPARAFPAEPEGLVRTVGILGGGTAGYLAALALRRKLPHLAVSLIESRDVPIIGVGEATTPLMPQFLHVDLGLDVHRLFREVLPTFKLGIRFLWGAPDDGDFHYPFGPVHALEPAVYGGDLRDCSLQSMLMKAGALPLYREERGGWTCRLGTEAAYHLDNERFVAYLQRRADEAGVEHIEATVVDAELSADGEEVSALVTRDGRRLSFDLYLDCSGFRSLLLEKGLRSPWIPFETSLWTDRAVVGPVPHGGTVRPYTTAETMTCGWCWSTPQGDADHRVYVFASAFQSPEEAEAEMRRSNPGMGPARLVHFRAGRHEHFWKGNVVALGNAYGFVEPLESTALHMLIREIGLLVRSFPVRRGERGLTALLNRKVGAWWDYLRWFLAIHYKFNRRIDSEFWRACRADVDVSSHAELLEAFRERGPLSYDPAAQSAFDYPDPLWGPEGIDALLLGQGVAGRFPRPALDRETWARRLELARSAVEQAATHERGLAVLGERPDLLAEWVAAYRAAGPAFPVGFRS